MKITRGFIPCQYHANIVYNEILVNHHLLQISRNILDHESLRHIYNTHIHSHLNYGLPVWESMIPKKEKDTLIKIQKSWVRIIAKRPKNANTAPLFHKYGIMTFDKMVSLELSKMGYKPSHKLYPKPILELFDKKRGEKPIGIPLETRTYQTLKCIKVPSSIRAFYPNRSEFSKLPGTTKESKVCTHLLNGGKNN